MNSKYSNISNEHKLKLRKLREKRIQKSGTSANEKNSAKISALEANNIALEANITAMEYKKGGVNMDDSMDTGEDEIGSNATHSALTCQSKSNKRNT